MSDCIVCGGSAQRPHYAGLIRCADCGHVATDLLLSDDELRQLYERSYFFGDEYSDYLADRDVLTRNFRRRLRTLSRFLDPARHRVLLEIGSAYGFFLDLVRERFDATGIDITVDGTRYANEQLKVSSICGDFLEHDFGDRTFDVVCMWDTIEHLPNPHLYLEKAARHTAKGALIAITTGDIESVVARVKKSSWRLIHPPTHLHYFSKRTLSRALANAGFDVVHQSYCGFHRSVDNIAYNLFVLRYKRPALYALMKRIGLTKLTSYLNLYDIMYVVARRR